MQLIVFLDRRQKGSEADINIFSERFNHGGYSTIASDLSQIFLSQISAKDRIMLLS
jgi:hypothetical protein